MRCECGEPIEPGQKFCIVCGRKITDAAVPDEDALLVRNTADQGDAAPDDSSELSDDSAKVSDGDTVVLGDLSSVSDESSDEADDFETDDSSVPSHGSGKKRTWHKVIIAVIVVLALVLAGFGGFALWGMKNGAAKTATSDKDTVHYSDSKASKVHKKTVIVLYGKDGKPLEQYKVNVMDDSGAVSSHSVTGGQFTPDEVGMKPGKQYTVVAKDSSGNVYSLPKTNVRPDSDASDDVHGDKLDVKPSDSQQDSKTEESSACAKQKMYLAYYDVISSLQKKYGEGEIRTDTEDDPGYLHGLSIVLLIDSDGDGDDELVTVHDTESDKNKHSVWGYETEKWAVQTWRYDEKTGKALNEHKGEPSHSNGGWIFLELIMDKDGHVTLQEGEDHELNSDSEYTNYQIFPIGDQFTSESSENYTRISGEETLSKTQETIDTITQGMMTDCNVSSAKSDDSSKAVDDMQIAVGGSYAKGYVLRDGVVWAIDDNGKASKMTGLPVISKLFIGGFNGNYALAKDGSLWAWGNPSSIFGLGSLGDGKPGDDDFSKKSGSPVKVHNLKNVTTMYSGLGRSYAVLKDGTAWTWGDECSSSGCSESYGEEILEPKQIDGLEDVVDVAGWHGVNYALKSDGTVLRWIDSKGTAKPDLPLEPTDIYGLPKIKSMSIGYGGRYFLDEQGNVWTPSTSSGVETTVTEPVKLSALPSIKMIKQVDANEDVGGVAYFIGTNGELWAYGSNGATCGDGNSAALGDGTCTTPDDPVRVKGISKVRDVTVAWGNSWALTDSGDLYQWGTCNGSGEQANIPKKIESGSVRKIYAAPSSYLMMVKKDGSIWGKSVSPTGKSDDFTQIQGIK